MAGILQRYYAGDGSLVAEIEANAVSSNPIAQLARGELEAPVDAVVPMEASGGGFGPGLETLMMVDAKMDAMDSKVEKLGTAAVGTAKELWELNAELHFSRNKMEKQTAAVAYLNTTIRTKDAQLQAKDEELAKTREIVASFQGLVDEVKGLKLVVTSMSDKLDSAMQVFF